MGLSLVPAGTPLLSLAAARLAQDRELRSVTVWLPTRRATIVLRDKLLANGLPPEALPRLHAVGEPPLNAAVCPPEERLAAAAGAALRVLSGITPRQAVYWAQEWLALLDRCAWAGITPLHLVQQPDAASPLHGQRRQEVLEALAHGWQPTRLPSAAEAAVEGLKQATMSLNETHRVWSLGVVSLSPVVLDFLKALHSLPEGEVFLPDTEGSVVDKMLDHLATAAPPPAGSARRGRLLHAITMPNPSRGAWQKIHENELSGLSLLVAPDARHLAAAVAALCKDKPDKDVVVVCTDAALSQNIVRAFAHAGVALTVSVPPPWAASPQARFVCAVLRVLEEPEAWEPTLALLRLPECVFGDNGALAPLLEYSLRSDTLRRRQAMPAHMADERQAGLLQKYNTLIDQAALAWRQASTASRRLTVLSDTVQALGASIHVPVVPDALPAVMAAPLVEAALKAQALVMPEATTARVHILGQWEARLAEADVVILADATEASWPGRRLSSPLLSVAQEKLLGSDIAAENTLLFRCLSAASEVVWARMAETSPCGFWLKAEAFAAVHGLILPHEDQALHTAQAVLFPPLTLAPVAAPCPPALARPSMYSVTSIDRLRRDPYAWYAAEILRLRALAVLEEQADHRDYGILMHRALEAAAQGHDPSPMLEAALKELLLSPAQQLVWRHRLHRTVAWVMQQHQTLARYGRQWVMSEKTIRGKLGDFILTARPDRVDRDAEGIIILDYKTGSPPTAKDLQNGKALQLLLEGALYNSEVRLEYWHLKGDRLLPGRRVAVDDAAALSAQAASYTHALLDAFAGAEQAYYPTGDAMEYKHLERNIL
ncbi:MAG: PD-(D/E)XK nuclease family protein [Holosporales bacterium]